MPFELCNALATFQLAMNDIFKGVIRKFVRPYLDDIMSYPILSPYKIPKNVIKTLVA
ncbi:hypothetical protein ENBRE01_2645 [Enteropsectra breve]|nr:hypothetical protein ENBRE01_2645 [Enteropsectra breve]